MELGLLRHRTLHADRAEYVLSCPVQPTAVQLFRLGTLPWVYEARACDGQLFVVIVSSRLPQVLMGASINTFCQILVRTMLG